MGGDLQRSVHILASQKQLVERHICVGEYDNYECDSSGTTNRIRSQGSEILVF